MGDDNPIINSPGQLRLFEQDHGWMPGDSAGDAGGIGTSTGSAIDAMAGDEAGSAGTAVSNGTDGTKPFTWQQSAQEAAFAKGGYFSHEGKLYSRYDGKTHLVTGDLTGDLELTPEQNAQLDKDRTASAEQERKTKDAMAQQEIVTEGFTPNPDGRDPNSGLSLSLHSPNPDEAEWLATYVGGPAGALWGVAKGMGGAGLNPAKHVGNVLINGGLGYSSGYGATKLALSKLQPPIVPRIEYK